MKLNSMIKTATLVSVLALGIQGAALAEDKRPAQGNRGGHLGGSILMGDGSVKFLTDGVETTSTGPGGGPHVRVLNGDGASGQSGHATGKRQHKPYTITKEIDQSTPSTNRPARPGRPQPGTPNSISNVENQAEIGLLLPAVQKVR